MRGFTCSWLCAASSARMPVYWPCAFVPPITLVLVSASVSPSATRTTIVSGRAWLAIAFSVRARVPVVPALPAAVNTLVMRTGVLSGNIVASASSAVATKPTTAVAMVRIGRVPLFFSMTRVPWW